MDLITYALAKREAKKVKSELENLNEQLAQSIEGEIASLKLKLAVVYRAKGSKADYEAILAVEDPEVGDVWDDSTTGMNYVWTGDEWDPLGMKVDLSDYYNKTETETLVENSTPIYISREEFDEKYAAGELPQTSKAYIIIER